MQCVICIDGPFKNVYVHLISMNCLMYQISKEGGFCREKLDHRVRRELRMCV